MTIDSATDQQSHPSAVVQAAVEGFRGHAARPDGPTLTAALLELERQTRKTHQSLSLDALQGHWRLCFTASKKAHFQEGKPTGSGFYIPAIAQAYLSFKSDPKAPQPLTIENQLRLLTLRIKFTGPAKYLVRKNLLAFDFSHLQVTLAGLPLYRGQVGSGQQSPTNFAAESIAQLPFFTFFAAPGEYIAARGRGGGLAVWAKDS